MLDRLFLVCAAVLIPASAAAQVTVAPGNAAFLDISGIGTAIQMVGDDTAHVIVSTVGNDLLPAGQLGILSNGYILGPLSASYQAANTFANLPITPTATVQQLVGGYVGPWKAVFPWWDDLYCGGAQANTTLYWLEASGVLYIQWNLIGHFQLAGGPTGPAITFQIQVVNGGGCVPSVIHMVYPDATFGGLMAYYDHGFGATVGYAGGPGFNAQWSYDTASIPDGLSLTIALGGFRQAWSSPLGPGSIKYEVCGGPPGLPYQLVATLNTGLYPNGWIYGVDITFAELLSEIGVPPFFGFLGPTGAASVGPIFGIPSGLTIYAVTLNVPPGSVPNHTYPGSYTTP